MEHVDLHCHSTASDGEYPPAEVARRAKAAGLAAFALTDHDTTAGITEAARAAESLGVRLVVGCEFSVKAPWGELHLLGYFLPVGNPALEGFLDGTRAARQRRANQIVVRLQRLGVAIELADVERAAGGGAMGRPHVARVLVERGASIDMNDAFRSYLGRGRPAYVEKPLPTLPQVADLVHAVGGMLVAAHLGDHGTGGSRPSPRDSASPSAVGRTGTATRTSETRTRRWAAWRCRWSGLKNSTSVAQRRLAIPLHRTVAQNRKDRS